MAVQPDEPTTTATTDLNERVSGTLLILSRLDDIRREQDHLRDDFSSLRQEFAAVRQDFSALRQEVKQDLASLRLEVKQDLMAQRQEFSQEISALRYWSWGSIVAVLVGVIAVILRTP